MVQDYNTYIRSFPQLVTAKLFGYAVKPNFTVDNEAQISQPPAVKFGAQAPAPAPAPPAPQQQPQSAN
ncbi:LemA family protein [compost metagenome]